MGKPQGVLKQRWKAIDPTKAGGDAGGGDDKKHKDGDAGKKDKKNDDDDKPATGAEQGKKPSKADKKAAKKEAAAAAEKKPPATTKPPSKAASDARFTRDEWVTLQEDELFSFGELQLLSELVAQYDAGRWGMVASRFFDKTGRRVHAEDVREKFMGVCG